MLKSLVNTVLRNGSDSSESSVRRAGGILLSIYGLVLNVLLFIGKLFAGMATCCYTVTADALNDLCGAGACVISLLSFSSEGKTEASSRRAETEFAVSIAVSVLILFIGLETARTAILRIREPQEVLLTTVPAMILIIGILVKLFMALYNNAMGRRTSSAVMQTAAADCLSDAVVTAFVLLALVIASTSDLNLDGFAALAVSLFILYSGVMSLKDALSPFLGRSADPALAEKIGEIISRYPEICSIHDLEINDYGPGRLFVSLAAEVPGNASMFETHDAVDAAEAALAQELGCSACIHTAPLDTDEMRNAAVRSALSDELTEHIHPELKVHDLRIVPGRTRTTLVFNVAVPAYVEQTDEELAEAVCELVRSTWDGFRACVTVSRE